MKLYAHTGYLDDILKNGYLSASRQENPGIFWVYRGYAKSEEKEDIIKYLESTFEGRLRSISCLTEAIDTTQTYKHCYLENSLKNASVVSFDLEELIKDRIVEAIYCKDCKENYKQGLEVENIYKIDDVSNIDTTTLNWQECDEKYGSPFNMLKHYMLVLKDGIIPAKYITKER